MGIRSNALCSLLSHPRAAALAIAGSLFVIGGAPAAQAQWFNMDSALPAMQIERMVQASGYRLTGPVQRNGAVYLADVLGSRDDMERLVIDARTGRIVSEIAESQLTPWNSANSPNISGSVQEYSTGWL